MDFTNNIPTTEERMLLVEMVFNSTLDEYTRGVTIEWIYKKCSNYRSYMLLSFKLEDVAIPFHQILNPSQKAITRFVWKIASNGD